MVYDLGMVYDFVGTMKDALGVVECFGVVKMELAA
ncbi:hypothetical protein BFJ71_g3248 [Fusarium oxysporum]|nr:hypothetical protein BFJ71_g3248 [Fusarium oxysporum]